MLVNEPKSLESAVAKGKDSPTFDTIDVQFQSSISKAIANNTGLAALTRNYEGGHGEKGKKNRPSKNSKKFNGHKVDNR